MPEIHHKTVKEYLKNLGTDQFAPVYLIYGEELLCKTALEMLLDVMVPASIQSFNYEPVDGTDANIFDVIERINTFSLMSGIKVVALRDSRIFDSKQDEEMLLEKAKEAYDNNDVKKAAAYLLSLLGLLSLSLEDINRENRSSRLKFDVEKMGDDDQWLDKIAGYCAENDLSISFGKDNAGILQKAIEKGFPQGHHLIITTDAVDKRRSLFKTIQKKGVTVDCSVPKGDRKINKDAQKAVLHDRMKTILTQHGKTMDMDASRAMYEMTGFELRTFSNNLEKLVSYTGDRKRITIDDVESVLQRTKKDPIYELTNAIADRNTERALFFLDSLLSGNLHPLQTLAVITNQVRRLLLVKGFVESPRGDTWHAGVSYGHFTNHIMPEIKAYDSIFLKQLEEWESMISKDINTNGETPKKKKKQKKSRKTITDLMVARDANNPYPVFQTLKNSEKFTKDDLLDAFEYLKKADFLLKSSGQNPKLILEDVIFSICK